MPADDPDEGLAFALLADALVRQLDPRPSMPPALASASTAAVMGHRSGNEAWRVAMAGGFI